MKSDRVKRLFLTVLIAASIFTLFMALVPKPPALLWANTNDKVQHMQAFATLTLLASATFRGKRSLAIFIALALFGAIIEILQMIPAFHRDAELSDWLADCAAILAALGLSALVRRMVRKV